MRFRCHGERETLSVDLFLLHDRLRGGSWATAVLATTQCSKDVAEDSWVCSLFTCFTLAALPCRPRPASTYVLCLWQQKQMTLVFLSVECVAVSRTKRASSHCGLGALRFSPRSMPWLHLDTPRRQEYGLRYRRRRRWTCKKVRGRGCPCVGEVGALVLPQSSVVGH